MRKANGFSGRLFREAGSSARDAGIIRRWPVFGPRDKGARGPAKREFRRMLANGTTALRANGLPSLHHEDGTPAGMNRCSVSLAEAKALGLRAAFLNNYLTREFANQQEWLGARFEAVKAAAIRTGAGGG